MLEWTQWSGNNGHVCHIDQHACYLANDTCHNVTCDIVTWLACKMFHMPHPTYLHMSHVSDDKNTLITLVACVTLIHNDVT